MKAAKVVALLVSVVLVVALIALFVFGAREHRTPIRIDVSMESGAPRLSFSRCGSRGGDAKLNVLEVMELRPGNMMREECQVLRRQDSTRLPQSWRYGAPEPEFELTGCDPLRPGKHSVSVSGPVQFGTRVIDVANDGSVTAVEPPCR